MACLGFRGGKLRDLVAIILKGGSDGALLLGIAPSCRAWSRKRSSKLVSAPAIGSNTLTRHTPKSASTAGSTAKQGHQQSHEAATEHL